MSKAVILSARGLGKTYHRRRGETVEALADVSFDLMPGQAFGVVGESGCGKSTLARILARLEDPDCGRVIYDNQCITDVSSRKFMRHPSRGDIQMVFQDPTGSLAPRFTVFDLISDPARQLKSYNNNEISYEIQNLLNAVGLPPEVMNRRPQHLSGGQRARVGIARALITRPRVLVLDEPTASLDASVQATVLRLLDRIRAERDIALVVISHDLHVIRLLCQDVMVMKAGRCIEAGKTETLFQAPTTDYTRALLAALPGLNESTS